MLTVYRASAGSGKTYKLTGEYLKLLFSGVGSFRHILAVTFTNKATDEMKSRIIQELDILARKEKSGYLNELMADFALSAEEVYRKSHRILLEILHDYSAFNISTIDRFFQQTMRAFAREIGLQGGYNVELDTKRVLTEAVDKMLFSLDEPNNKDLLNWLLKFAEDKIENGKSWNFKKEVIELGEELFKEKYKRLSSSMQEKLRDKESLKVYLKTINKVVLDFELKLASIGKEGVNLINQAGFEVEDFAGGSGSPLKHFAKWANKEVKEPTATFCKLEDNLDNWKASGKTKHAESAIKAAYSGGLHDCVKMAIAHFADISHYNTAIIIRKNIYTLGILYDIDSKIKELIAENNLMLLSDTTHLLNKLIDGNDTPFIYEKIGVRIKHYMIDEFQDTSVMQWQNFSPLIHESLSNTDPEARKLSKPDEPILSNLIVGDVKQSIYRWRSSDWKLLDEQLGLEFPRQIKDEVLNENWRSGSAIIGFNNAFFTASAIYLQNKFIGQIPEVLSDHPEIKRYATKIVDAYKDVYQQLPKEKKAITGHVKMQWIEAQNNNEWKDAVLLQLPNVIAQWQDKGYALRDMAVLVRTKAEGSMVADCLLKYKRENPTSNRRFDVISDEALLVKNATPIKLIIALLKHLRMPNDEDLKRIALIEYAVLIHKSDSAVSDFFRDSLGRASLHFVPEQAKELLNIGKLPLYEMCERLISVFIESPDETDNLFLQAFQDMVLDFSTRKSADLIAFLDWWEESGQKKSVSMPPSQNAIRIMTIHKAKGLGFKAVIVPFCDWDIDQKAGSMLWCAPSIEPFNEIPLLPVPYTKVMGNSIFAFDYLEEKLHAYIDNLNLAYVTFTRAKEELMIFAPKPPKPTTESLGGLLYECITNSVEQNQKDKEFISLKDKFTSQQLCYEDGIDWTPTFENETRSAEERAFNFRSVNPDGRLQLKLRSRDFFADSEEQKYGKLMHEILSRIHTSTDILNAVVDVENLGEITSEKGVEIAAKIKNWIEKEEVASWFAPTTRVMNETDILLPNGDHYRPDRVVFLDKKVHVIDFKFGQKKANKYHQQVATYMSLIAQMGYLEVEGYLWYVELDEVESVTII